MVSPPLRSPAIRLTTSLSGTTTVSTLLESAPPDTRRDAHRQTQTTVVLFDQRRQQRYVFRGRQHPSRLFMPDQILIRAIMLVRTLAPTSSSMLSPPLGTTQSPFPHSRSDGLNPTSPHSKHHPWKMLINRQRHVPLSLLSAKLLLRVNSRLQLRQGVNPRPTRVSRPVQ